MHRSQMSSFQNLGVGCYALSEFAEGNFQKLMKNQWNHLNFFQTHIGFFILATWHLLPGAGQREITKTDLQSRRVGVARPLTTKGSCTTPLPEPTRRARRLVATAPCLNPKPSVFLGKRNRWISASEITVIRRGTPKTLRLASQFHGRHGDVNKN